jgi:hypothetical protein
VCRGSTVLGCVVLLSHIPPRQSGCSESVDGCCVCSCACAYEFFIPKEITSVPAIRSAQNMIDSSPVIFLFLPFCNVI